jgi:DeoR/GlpR family transcriptional regulator of sugar metabolism
MLILNRFRLPARGRRRIREILGQQDRVTVNELSKPFRVTAFTIRNDLDSMAAEGALIRDRGWCGRAYFNHSRVASKSELSKTVNKNGTSVA